MLALGDRTSVELEAVNVAIGAWTAIHIRNSARFFSSAFLEHRAKPTDSPLAILPRGVSLREETEETRSGSKGPGVRGGNGVMSDKNLLCETKPLDLNDLDTAAVLGKSSFVTPLCARVCVCVCVCV